MTAVESPPGFPEHPPEWRIEPFGALFEVQQGKQVSRATRAGPDIRPFLRTKNVNWGHVDAAELDSMNFTDRERKRLALEDGDLLICEGGDIGRTAVWRGDVPDCFYQNHLHRARLREPETGDSEFMQYWLWYAFAVGGVYFGRGNVTTIPNLSKSRLCELPIPVPPIDEQRRIKSVLGLVRQAIGEQRQLLRLCIELRATLVGVLLAQGLRGQEVRESEIGPIPVSWELVRFNHCVSIASGQVDPRQHPYSEMMHVGPENIESGSGRLYGLQSNSALGIASGNYLFDENDVLYSKIRPYLNKAALPDFSGTCSADMYPIRADPEDFDRAFLFDVVLSPAFLRQARSFQDRTGIPKINRAQLGAIMIPKPSVEEQRDLAEVVRSCDAHITSVHAKIDVLEETFRTLLHDLMSANRRVPVESGSQTHVAVGTGGV